VSADSVFAAIAPPATSVPTASTDDRGLASAANTGRALVLMLIHEVLLVRSRLVCQDFGAEWRTDWRTSGAV
jgi:hypothetical protein